MDDFAEKYAEAWCSGVPENVAGFFSPKGSLKVNDGEPAVGRAAITELARGFMASFPDLIVNFDKLAPSKEGTEFHWTLTGTNTGPGGTGKCVLISGYEIWRIGPDGLIAESNGHFDEAEFHRQLANGFSAQSNAR